MEIQDKSINISWHFFFARKFQENQFSKFMSKVQSFYATEIFTFIFSVQFLQLLSLLFKVPWPRLELFIIVFLFALNFFTYLKLASKTVTIKTAITFMSLSNLFAYSIIYPCCSFLNLSVFVLVTFTLISSIFLFNLAKLFICLAFVFLVTIIRNHCFVSFFIVALPLVLIETLCFRIEKRIRSFFVASAIENQVNEVVNQLLRQASDPFIIFNKNGYFHCNAKCREFFEKMPNSIEEFFAKIKVSYEEIALSQNHIFFKHETKDELIQINRYDISYKKQQWTLFSINQVRECFLTYLKEKNAKWNAKLVSKISHEFITPLISIKGYADEDEGKNCNNIAVLCDYLVSLVNETSILMNPEKFQYRCECSIFSFNAFIDRITAQTNALAKISSSLIFKATRIIAFNEGVQIFLNQFEIYSEGNEKFLSVLFLNIFKILGQKKEEVEMRICLGDGKIKVSANFKKQEDNTDFCFYDEKLFLSLIRKMNQERLLELELLNDQISFEIPLIRIDHYYKSETTIPYLEGYYFERESEMNNLSAVDIDSSFDSEEEIHEKVCLVGEKTVDDVSSNKILLESQEKCFLPSQIKVISSSGLDMCGLIKVMRQESFSLIDYGKGTNIIVVVDDSKFIRQSLKKNLLKQAKSLGINVWIEMLEDGIDLLSFIKKSKKENEMRLVKAIICDEYMSFLNGTVVFDLLQEFVKDNKIENIPFIFYTAFLENDFRNNIMKRNPFKLLSKPAEVSEVIALLKELNL